MDAPQPDEKILEQFDGSDILIVIGPETGPGGEELIGINWVRKSNGEILIGLAMEAADTVGLAAALLKACGVSGEALAHITGPFCSQYGYPLDPITGHACDLNGFVPTAEEKAFYDRRAD